MRKALAEIEVLDVFKVLDGGLGHSLFCDYVYLCVRCNAHRGTCFIAETISLSI